MNGYVFHDTDGEGMDEHWRTSGHTWWKLVRTSACWSLMGEKNLKTVYYSSDGKKCTIGNVYVFIGNKDHFYRYMWTTSKWLERGRIWVPCGRNWSRTWIWMKQHHFLITCIWDVLNVNANQTKKVLTNSRRCSNHVYLLEQLKNCEEPHAKTVEWSYDTEGHARKCVERYCELTNKKAEQLYKVSSPCLDDHHFKKEELETGGALSEVCSHIVLEMRVFGTNWQTRHSTVSEQTCSISHKMDTSLWQTFLQDW